ncbi:MAG: hypothetical protein HY314_12085 [Acidobacteria bacterium]|nr:hypothetical protein [Acidobacteriota bacterium]
MKRLKVTICLFVLALGSSTLPKVEAHHLTIGEVLEILNRHDVKARTGIGEAQVDVKLKRHLIISVNTNWYKLPEPHRLKLAAAWLEMWRDAVKDGIVSVVDAVSNQPVVNYGPSGRVSLTKG